MAEEPDLLITPGFSDAKLVQEADRIVALYKKKGEEAQKAFETAQGKVTNTQAVRAHMREVDRLARTYDPAYRAAKTYEKAVKDLDKALDIGAISQKQYAAQVGAAAKQFNTAANELDTVARKGVQGGTGLQNTAFQLQDVAVQIGAGTSAAQAFGQQLPQLLSGFGTFGILAGTAAAVVLPLGAYLLKAAFDSKTLDDRLKELSETTEDYTSKAEAARTPIETLRQRYGDLADEVQRANSAIAMMAGLRAQSDALGAAQSLGRTLGIDLNPVAAPVQWDGTVNADRQRMATEQQEKAMEQLRAKTGATAEQADRLRMAINRTNSANSLDAVIRDSENLLSILAELSANANADQGFLGGWSQQIQAVMQAAQDQLSATRSEMERVSEQYETDTEKLKSLSKDREIAQKALDDAIRTGNEEAVRAWNDRLDLIDAEISKTQALALANDDVFEAMQKRLQSRFPQIVDGAVEAATGTSLSQWGKDLAASQKGILDLIASRESGGDYNATLDNGRWTGGPRNLVNMTLNEIRALQDTMRTPENRALYGNGDGSSALGRYQIVGTTLEGLMKELGLTGNELFSPEMQDRLAMQLLRSVKPGDISGIRGIWAGLDNVAPAVINQAWGQQSITRLDPELQREQDEALKDQIRERERLAKQAKDYGAQLAQNLLTERETTALKAQQAEQIAAIRAQGLDPEAESRAIAEVTASIEQQRTVMTLLADAKRRNVDLDAMLADGSMTYRQAIEALGETKRADIIADNERAIAQGKAAEAQQFMADVQERTKQGLLDAIVLGESFTDVLANLAQMFARAAAEAALFNSGPFASGGGGGLLGGLFSGIFGGGDALTGALRRAGAPVPLFGGFRAAGGPVSAGQMYITGEKGPEPFIPAVDGRILSVEQAQAAIRGGRGGSWSFSPSTSIVIQGNADQGALSRLQRDLDDRDNRLRREIPAILRKHNLTDG